MRIKIQPVLCVLSVILLTALGILAFAGQAVSPYILISSKTEDGGAALTALEDIREDGWLLTYTLRAAQSVTALTARYDVTMYGVNCVYPAVMGTPMLSGSFFTRSAQDAAARQAVLNAKAAFDLFGGMDITGSLLTLDRQTYHVVGVMDDGDEQNRNLYIPAALLGRRAAVLAALYDEQTGFSEQYVLNELKQAGVTEARYELLNLAKLRRQLFRMLRLALGVVFCALVLLLGCKLMPPLRAKLRALKKDAQKLYPGQLLRQKPAAVCAAAGLSLCLLLMTGLLLGTLGGMAALALNWETVALFPRNAAEYTYAADALRLHWYAVICFAAFCVVCPLCIVTSAGILPGGLRAGSDKWR